MDTTITTKGEDIMTDYQYKSILAMVCQMFDGCVTAEDYAEKIKTIAKLSQGEIPKSDLLKDEKSEEI
jgi:hypothetical protein